MRSYASTSTHTCRVTQPDTIWPIAVTTRDWRWIIWVIRTSPTRSGTQERQRSALRDCGGEESVVFCPFAKQTPYGKSDAHLPHFFSVSLFSAPGFSRSPISANALLTHQGRPRSSSAAMRSSKACSASVTVPKPRRPPEAVAT